MAEKIDLNTLPKGLTKEEFTALPNFKKIRSFFTWAGVVSIGSGVLICSEYGKVCQSVLRAGGSLEEVNQLWAVKLNMLFMVISIVIGILLIKKKTTKMAYIVAITELVYALLAIISGGSVGVGVIALALSLAVQSELIRNGNSIRKYLLETNRGTIPGIPQPEQHRTIHIQKFTHPKLLIMEAPGSRRKKIMILYQLTALKAWRKH